MDQFKEAAATFERAVKRNVDDDFPWIYLASSYGHLGRFKDADDAIESANDLRARRGESFLNLESRTQWHFHGEIDFSRFGEKQAQERLRAGLTEIPALTWLYCRPGQLPFLLQQQPPGVAESLPGGCC